MFMHNGGIPDFYKHKSKFLLAISDFMVGNIKGTTDTEHCFGYLMNGFPSCDYNRQYDLEFLVWQVLRTIRFVVDSTPKACSLNFAFTDGMHTIATRYRNGNLESPPALYYSIGCQFKCDNGRFVRRPIDESGRIDAVLISSEPLTYDAEQWHMVHSNHILIVGPAASGAGKHFDNVPILIGSRVDRIFQQWKKFALTGKNIKGYTEQRTCGDIDPNFVKHLTQVFSWAGDFKHIDTPPCKGPTVPIPAEPLSH